MLSEFGAEEQKHAGVVHPDQDHGERASCAKRVTWVAMPEVKTDDEFSDLEKNRSRDRTSPDRSPGHDCVWQKLEHRGEQERQHNERGELVHCLNYRGRATESTSNGADCGRDRQKSATTVPDGAAQSVDTMAVIDVKCDSLTVRRRISAGERDVVCGVVITFCQHSGKAESAYARDASVVARVNRCDHQA